MGMLGNAGTGDGVGGQGNNKIRSLEEETAAGHPAMEKGRA